MDARATEQVAVMEGRALIWGVSCSLVQQLEPHEPLAPVDHHPEDLEQMMRLGHRSRIPSAPAMRLHAACTLSLGNTRKARSDAHPASAVETPRAAQSQSTT